MNKDHGLTAENLLAVFPSALRNDKSMRALASSIANILATRPSEIDTLRIYANIDALPEEMLDILAYDFKVDWWDYDYSLEEKRQTLKDSWKVHRMLGTKAAVETAISAIYPDTTVEEWFEYGGNPYTFRLVIDTTDMSIDPERHRRVLDLVNYYKNLRSHFDRVKYTLYPTPASAVCASAFCGSYMRVGVNVQLSGKVDRPHILFPVHTGVAIAETYTKLTVAVKTVPVEGRTVLVDEMDNYLLDEAGDFLIE